MDAWHHWYHITITAYGQWLPGDERGWRTRHHREHVEGDYRHRPEPSAWQGKLLQRSRALMTHEAAWFGPDDRGVVGERIVESLGIQKIVTRAVAVAATHVHILARCPRDDAKQVGGKCKRNVTRFYPRDGGGPWFADDSHVEPVTCARHYLAVEAYIARHREQGAWVWVGEVGVA